MPAACRRAGARGAARASCRRRPSPATSSRSPELEQAGEAAVRIDHAAAAASSAPPPPGGRRSPRPRRARRPRRRRCAPSCDGRGGGPRTGSAPPLAQLVRDLASGSVARQAGAAEAVGRRGRVDRLQAVEREVRERGRRRAARGSRRPSRSAAISSSARGHVDAVVAGRRRSAARRSAGAPRRRRRRTASARSCAVVEPRTIESSTTTTRWPVDDVVDRVELQLARRARAAPCSGWMNVRPT